MYMYVYLIIVSIEVSTLGKVVQRGTKQELPKDDQIYGPNRWLCDFASEN